MLPLVQSRDPETGRSMVSRVLQAIRRSVDSVITLELASAKGGPVLQRLTGTPDHPIFTPRGQVPLSALGIGTEVISRAGPNLVVRGIIRRHEPGGVAVYNLDVEADHTYFVGASAAVWVHNGGPCFKIHRVHPDWAVKGAHITVNGIELAVRPGAGGKIVFKPVFARDHPKAVEIAQRMAATLLDDPGFIAPLLDKVRSAKTMVLQFPNEGGVGRSAELHFLEKSLARMLGH